LSYLTTNGYIGMGKQTAFGTAWGPEVGLFIKYLSESLLQEQDDIKAVEGGQGRNIIEAYKSTHKAGGEVSFYARPDVAGFFLAMAMGADSYAAGPPMQHTLTPALPHYFTIERCIDPATAMFVERIQDCAISEITIEGESSQPWKVTATLMGTKGALLTMPGTPTYEDNDPIMFFDTPVYTHDGVPTTEISKFSIKLSNNLDEWYGTTMTRAAIIAKLLTVEVAFTLKFENATHYKAVYYGGGTAVVDTLDDGNLTVKAGYGAGATERSMQIECKNIKHIGAAVHLAGEAAPIFQECVGYARKVTTDNIIDAVIKGTYSRDYDTNSGE